MGRQVYAQGSGARFHYMGQYVHHVSNNDCSAYDLLLRAIPHVELWVSYVSQDHVSSTSTFCRISVSGVCVLWSWLFEYRALASVMSELSFVWNLDNGLLNMTKHMRQRVVYAAICCRRKIESCPKSCMLAGALIFIRQVFRTLYSDDQEFWNISMNLIFEFVSPLVVVWRSRWKFKHKLHWNICFRPLQYN